VRTLSQQRLTIARQRLADEPLRHGDGSEAAVCALLAAGFFGGAIAPSDAAEPYRSTAGTGTISHPCRGLPKLGSQPAGSHHSGDLRTRTQAREKHPHRLSGPSS
jgi:hypothetical protein